MGWSLPYTLGVLARWKMAPAYCRAVLAQEHRVALDGSPAEAIDAKAKDLAAKRLARLAERETANETAKPAAPVPVESKPAETSPETPEQLRARVRASLMRRRAQSAGCCVPRGGKCWSTGTKHHDTILSTRPGPGY